MAERLMPTVVFLGTFMIVSGILVAGLSTIVALNRVADTPGDYEELVGGDLFTFIKMTADPDEDMTDNVIDGGFVGWSSDDVLDLQTTYSVPAPYTNRDVACYVVRNATTFFGVWEHQRIEEPNCEDYMLFYQSKRVYWGMSYSYSHAYLTPLMVSENVRTGYNYSDISFKLWDWFTARFWVPEGVDIMDAIYANNYSITLGLSYNSSVTSTSPWAMVAQFLTLQLPDMDFHINLILAVPIWFAVGFFVLTLLSRFMPTIPGG